MAVNLTPLPSPAPSGGQQFAEAVTAFPKLRSEHIQQEAKNFEAVQPQLAFLTKMASLNPHLADSPDFANVVATHYKEAGLPPPLVGGKVDLNILGAHSPIFDALLNPAFVALVKTTPIDKRSQVFSSITGSEMTPQADQLLRSLPFQPDIPASTINSFVGQMGNVLRMAASGNIAPEAAITSLEFFGRPLGDMLGPGGIDSWAQRIGQFMGPMVQYKLSEMLAKGQLDQAKAQQILQELGPKIRQINNMADLEAAKAEYEKVLAKYTPGLMTSHAQYFQRAGTSRSRNSSLVNHTFNEVANARHQAQVDAHNATVEIGQLEARRILADPSEYKAIDARIAQLKKERAAAAATMSQAAQEMSRQLLHDTGGQIDPWSTQDPADSSTEPLVGPGGNPNL